MTRSALFNTSNSVKRRRLLFLFFTQTTMCKDLTSRANLIMGICSHFLFNLLRRSCIFFFIPCILLKLISQRYSSTIFVHQNEALFTRTETAFSNKSAAILTNKFIRWWHWATKVRSLSHRWIPLTLSRLRLYKALIFAQLNYIHMMLRRIWIIVPRLHWNTLERLSIFVGGLCTI